MWAAGPAVAGLAEAVEGPVHTWGRNMHATCSHLDWRGGPTTGGRLKTSRGGAQQTRDQRRLTA